MTIALSSIGNPNRLSRLVAVSLVVLLAALVGRPASLTAADNQTPAAPENIALGKKYTLFPAPNYSHCTDPDDRVQLTDGKTTKNYFWTQKGTVGWTNAPYVTILLDLGKDEPIEGVAFDTAAGTAGVEWPLGIDILTSTDGKRFRWAGDLVAQDLKHNGPWPKGYAIRRLTSHDMKTHGRYVLFLVARKAGCAYLFCDEVEVYRGPQALLAENSGEEIRDVKAFYEGRKFTQAAQGRFQTDLLSLESAIREAHLAEAVQKGLLGRLEEIGSRLSAGAAIKNTQEGAAASHRTVLPLTPVHAELFGVQAAWWREMGMPALSHWVPATWDMTPLVAVPPKSGGEIEVHLLRGEHRAAAINLANSQTQPVEVALSFSGEAASAAVVRRAVQFHEVPWTDTSAGTPVTAALPEMQPSAEGVSTTSVQPGLVRQVWMTFHVDRQTPPGEYRANLVLRSGASGQAGTTREVPVRMHVYPIDFPQQASLSVGGWCYTNGKGSGGVTSANRQALVKHLRERLVNCPWATSGVLFSCKFPANDPDAVELQTEQMDDWLAQWPGAKRYMVFLAAGPTWNGVRYSSPEFPRRVKAWISAWVRYLGTKGIAPEQLGLLIHDEPHEATDVGAAVAWAKAIRAAEPKVRIWEDPTYSDPNKAPAELMEACHVLCPNRPMWLASAKRFSEFYLKQQQSGRTLELYSCSGPARMLDPYSYYRLQAWHCWQIGGAASWFWAFSDNGKASSWNEYLAAFGPYTPLFLDETSVVAGKQMEAIRESAEDYECLLMLRRAIDAAKAAGKTGPELVRAESLLTDGVAKVLSAPGVDKIFWRDPKDRTIADTVRIEVLKALVALSAR